MIRIFYAALVGVVVVWGINNFPNFFGYAFIGLISLFIINKLKSK